MPYGEQIRWPDEYKLSEADFYIHNRTDIKASPETVWNILIQAKTWPNWYEGMSNVKVQGSSEGTLKDRSYFTFRTMGRDFDGTIREFVPFQRLAWETTNKKLNAYHAWLIVPTEEGCRVITDESQHGKLARLQKAFLPRKLQNLHDLWLAELKRKAESDK